MTEKITFAVKGMSCNHCKMAVEKALTGVNGVDGAKVNLEAQNVTVTYEPDVIGAEQLKAFVKDAGYEPV